PLQQILLATPPHRVDFGRGPDGALVLEEALEHADRRVVRGDLALRRVAVPAAVAQLLADEAAREALGRTSEVRPERERATVDARLDLALEEGLRVELLGPAEAGLEARHRRVDDGVGAIGAGRAEELEREERRQPVRLAGLVPRAVRSLARE